jgi:hypothetical protein
LALISSDLYFFIFTFTLKAMAFGLVPIKFSNTHLEMILAKGYEAKKELIFQFVQVKL